MNPPPSLFTSLILFFPKGGGLFSVLFSLSCGLLQQFRSTFIVDRSMCLAVLKVLPCYCQVCVKGCWAEGYLIVVAMFWSCCISLFLAAESQPSFKASGTLFEPAVPSFLRKSGSLKAAAPLLGCWTFFIGSRPFSPGSLFYCVRVLFPDSTVWGFCL